MRARGASVSNLGAIGRLRRAIDRALALVPDYLDALVGKAAVLLNLPRLLGGNPREGEQLLRHVLDVDPGHAIARLFLAQALAERGARVEARRQVESVLALAEQAGNAVDAAEARLMFANLDD
jgi:cytochrome c-type biogenesis protein CcmH/NrfG